jgi:CRP-like cAMP-binding protein
MVGTTLFMGGGSTPGRAVVRSAGHAWRMPARVLQENFRSCLPMTHLLLRYTQALIAQMSQMAVCNRHHSIEQRLSLWLLQTLDRLPGNTLLATHELIAHALGVRRESVTQAMQTLQQAAVLSASRGQIEVLDSTGLAQHACECYGVLHREYQRLLPKTSRPRA